MLNAGFTVKKNKMEKLLKRFIMINKTRSLTLVLLTLTVFLSSCEAIEGIFKAGLWIGIIIVIAVVALIFWIMRKLRR